MIDITKETSSRNQELDAILAKYMEKSPSIQAITVVSPDGLPIASTSDEEETVISAMTAASQSLSERVLSQLNQGKMRSIEIPLPPLPDIPFPLLPLKQLASCFSTMLSGFSPILHGRLLSFISHFFPTKRVSSPIVLTEKLWHSTSRFREKHHR